MGMKQVISMFPVAHLITLSFFFFFFFIRSPAANGNVRHQKKLFVFGDSYADTGNWPKATAAVSWKKPYGMTFPGEPSGRFSDGRVLTDYIASFLGTESPITWSEWRGFGRTRELSYGMNFAHGGTGVFNTLVNQPNLTTQINFFQQLVQEEDVYDRHDLSSSFALLSVAGNDYATFLIGNGSTQDLPEFSQSIMRQLELDLERIHGLGVGKVGITSMEPIGCLPQMTAPTGYSNCTEAGNSIAKFHNQILQQTVDKLNNQTSTPVFQILDLYTAFMAALDFENNNPTGDRKTENPVLRPCCVGSGKGHSCGSVSNLGRNNYVVCENPKMSFFWDEIHLTQEGWFAVFSAIKPSLQNLLL